MVETCEVDIPRTEIGTCPPCTEIFFERVLSRVGLTVGRATLPLVVTRRYLLRKCFEGLGVAGHVHSLTLLPGEEVEIEIVRRSKFARALHEQRSVESEFSFELQDTARDEWSAEEESNFKITGDVGFKVFGIGAKSTQEYASREKTAEQHFREIVTKTASKVSRKFEVSIDTKSEVENQYRSVRKIRNPNACQPVIYHYFQLAKRYRTELHLTDVRFDLLPSSPPPVLIRPLQAVAFAGEAPYRQELNLQVVAPPPPWTIAASTTGQPEVARSLLQSGLLQSQVQLAQLNVKALPPVQAPVEAAEAQRLTRDELLEKLRREQPNVDAEEAARALDRFLAEDVNELGVRDTYDYCVNTDGLYVETSLSRCSACGEHHAELQRLEVAKAELELERLRGQPSDG